MTDHLDSIGGWPVLGTKPGGNWNESSFDIMSDLVFIRYSGVSPFIQVFLGLDEKDSGKRMIKVKYSSTVHVLKTGIALLLPS
jgi:hypothetical protein